MNNQINKELKDQINQLINYQKQQIVPFFTHYQKHSSILTLLAEFDETEPEVVWTNLTWREIGHNNHQPLLVSDLKEKFKGNLFAAVENEFALITKDLQAGKEN